jgi:hypothetical protein
MESYEVRAPTATSDRVCRAVSDPADKCEPGVTYKSANATLTSDILCHPVSECEGGQYEQSEPTVTADRVCAVASSGGSNTGGIAGGVVAALLLIVLVVVLLVVVKRRRGGAPIMGSKIGAIFGGRAKKDRADESEQGYKMDEAAFDEASVMENSTADGRLRRNRPGSVSFNDTNVEVAVDMAESPRDGTLDVSLARELITAKHIGQRVFVVDYGWGTLRYCGMHAVKSGRRCGVELDEPVGRNDGSVDGYLYFHADPGYGILVRYN